MNFHPTLRLLPKGWLKIPRGLDLVILITGAFILVLTLMTLFAPILAPADPNAQNLSLSLKGASSNHPLGTDKMGRDLLSRVIFGGQTTLLSALVVVSLSTLIGIPFGLVAGFFRGRIDSIISRVFDVLLAFPALLLALIIVASFGRGAANAVLALVIVYVPMIARLVRSATMVEAVLPYVEAGRALGFSSLRIMVGHILPNILPLILVQAAIDFAYSILDLAALSFIGLGVQPPQADWGAMLAEGREYLLMAPHLAIVPGIAIMATVIVFNLLGDALRERQEQNG